MRCQNVTCPLIFIDVIGMMSDSMLIIRLNQDEYHDIKSYVHMTNLGNRIDNMFRCEEACESISSFKNG